jgi:hypothetical protein
LARAGWRHGAMLPAEGAALVGEAHRCCWVTDTSVMTAVAGRQVIAGRDSVTLRWS